MQKHKILNYSQQTLQQPQQINKKVIIIYNLAITYKMKLKQKRKMQISIDMQPSTPQHKRTSITSFQYFDRTPLHRRSHTLGDLISLSETRPLTLTHKSIKDNKPDIKRVQSSYINSINFFTYPQQPAPSHKDSSSKNKLLFKPKKPKTIDRRLQRKQKLQQNFTQLTNTIRKIVQQLQQVIKQIQQEVRNMFKTVSQDIEGIVKEINKQYEKISVYKGNGVNEGNVENSFIGRNQESEGKIDYEHQVPTLDFSKINEGSQKNRAGVKNQEMYHSRKAQTQRNIQQRQFDFSIPMRTSRKFQNFNETLNRIKRISFGGCILKL